LNIKVSTYITWQTNKIINQTFKLLNIIEQYSSINNIEL